MKFVIKLIQKITNKKLPIHLGRWNIDYCSKKVNQKIDLSNEDNCGPCGQYAMAKMVSKPTSIQKYESTPLKK